MNGARRVALVTFVIACVLVGALLVSSASVAAAGPEPPVTGGSKEVTARTATLEGGVLNPGATEPVEAGEWSFLYAAFSGGCVEQSNAPEVFGVALGLPKEAVSVKLTGLQPNAPYMFCLYERNVNGEATGNAVPFQTLPAPPEVTPGSESATTTGFSATFNAAVNPNNQETTWFFEYATSEAELGTPAAKHAGGEPPLSGFGEQGVSATVTGLTQDTTYFYRVVAENEQSGLEEEPALGPIQPVPTLTPEPPETLPATEIAGTSATFNGVVNPNHEGEAGTYEFVYRASATQCEREGAPEKTTGAVEDAAAREEVHATVELLPGTTYTFCLLAHTASGEALGPPQSFTTPTIAPTLGEESFTGVSSTGATLHAKIDPGGSPTSYFFEYGPTTAYGTKTPLESAGGGTGTVTVTVQETIEHLAPETTYHFRVVVSSTGFPTQVPGADDSFSTFATGILGLPDNRGYEIVSSLENGDATVLMGSPMQAAADGNAVVYMGTPSPEGGTGEFPVHAGERPLGANAYLARRPAGGGWTAHIIQPNGLKTAVYRGFSSDLSTGLLTSEEPLFAGASAGQALYSRDAAGGYSLLATNASYEGSTADGGHVLFTQGGAGLFDQTAGGVRAVGVLPASEGGTVDLNAALGTGPNRERVISTDGSRIFWTDAATGDLYVRENDTQPGAATVLIAREARYMTASTDGAKVFFTDGNELTPGSTAAPGAPDLYEESVETGAITDLSIAANGKHTDVVGVLGASGDGSYVYFAAAGALPNSGAEPQECLPGQGSTNCNVYVAHRGEAPRFVATVAEVDGEGTGVYGGSVINQKGAETAFGDWAPELGNRSAHVTPDGRRLVFESFQDLTPFRGEGGREIYMYDVGSGLGCISCNPTGTSTVHGRGGTFEVAHAELPESASRTYPLRDVSADGNRVFFLSNEALVSQVTNEGGRAPQYSAEVGLANVYEWEREGTGESCPAKTPPAASGGCIFLLSDGTSSDISFFIDASESGDDVFLATRAQLVPQDHGEAYEVYDARAGAPREPSPPACTGSGCQGVPPAPPIFATPSSVTIVGVDNFAPRPATKVKKKTKCPKGKKLNHGKCSKSSGKKRQKAKKARNHRKAK